MAPSVESGNLEPCSQSIIETTDSDTDSVLYKLRIQLEEERENSKRLCADLAVEIEKHQNVLSLLEEERRGREEEQGEREVQLKDLKTQLSLVQSQCLEMQQYKAEKDKLNREMLELKKNHQLEKEAESSISEEALASSALHVQALEEEMKILREEHRMEVEQIKQLLEEREKELKMKEEEMMGFKAAKNRHNQSKAIFVCEERCFDETNVESGPDQDIENVSIAEDVLMERYLSSAPIAQSQSSMVNESFERCSQQDFSADHRLEKC